MEGPAPGAFIEEKFRKSLAESSAAIKKYHRFDGSDEGSSSGR